MTSSQPVALGPGQSDSGPGSLPTDVARDIARRVGVAAIVLASVWVVVAIMANATGAVVRDIDPSLHYAWEVFGNPLAAAQIALAPLVVWAARRFRERPRLVLGIGLAHELATAAGVAAIMQWNPPAMGRGISWLCLLIVTYPAMVPARPLAVFLVSLAVASMDPLFYALAVRAGVTTPLPTYLQAWAFIPNYIAAGLAVIPARIVRGLGQAVREARQLGNYRLEERLGAGGMGEVYRASHRLLARPAAVKVIAPQHLGLAPGGIQSLVVERFRREASAAASLRSPHTIELYDFGVVRGGSLFYAMELLDGIDLQTLVTRHGPQPPGRVIHLLRQACLSLAEAHQRGMVHRDVKPSNLMICRMGTQVDFLKVLDFGLVKVSAPGDAALTAPDVTAGTPAYLPPEAIDGVHLLDHRADLYALGCVGYWLLAGRPVFDAASPLVVLMKHARDEPPPIASDLGPVPRDLEAVIRQCLAKAPDDRPADALILEAALAACADAGSWGPSEAAAWWDAHLPACPEPAPGAQAGPGSAGAAGTLVRAGSGPD